MSEDDFVLFAPRQSSNQPSVAHAKSKSTPSKELKLTSAKTFPDLGLDREFCKILSSLTIKQPTPIQQAAIPAILSQANFIGSAPTGTGKTAAFALPLLQRLAQDPFGIFALILTPTRELAFQISEQLHILGQCIPVRVCTVTGGVGSVDQQLLLKRKPHFVVATPGRLLDLMKSSSDAIDLSRIASVVLDEADRLTTGTLALELSQIFSRLPCTAQRIAVSATLPSDLPSSSLREYFDFTSEFPIFRAAAGECEGSVNCAQKYILVPGRVRECYLVHLLADLFSNCESTLIFCSRCSTVEFMWNLLGEILAQVQEREVKISRLHSKMPQKERLASLADFRAGRSAILISTDVASRGLDIPQTSLVINYDIPNTAPDYVHRIGRTGRAGKLGTAINIVTEHDIELVQHIESTTGQQWLEQEGVSENKALERLNKVTKVKREIMLREESTKERGKKKPLKKAVPFERD